MVYEVSTAEEKFRVNVGTGPQGTHWEYDSLGKRKANKMTNGKSNLCDMLQYG
jgi:hypothetical protein